MALPFPIAASQVDAKSPLDDDIMQAIKADLEYLDNQITTSKSFDYEFKINGPLANYPVGQRQRLDGTQIARAQTFTRARLQLQDPGTSGTLQIDVRKYKEPNTPITAIASIFTDSINSIAQVAPNIATQSISLATASVATQSISRWKATINITSIILLGNNLVRYNLATLPDADWVVGDSVTFAGATAGANNITTPIVRINDDGVPNIVVTNASGVAQTGAAGTAGLNAWSYNYTNPLNAHFVAGESAIFATHTTPGNNGTFALYAVNSGGNNLVVKNSAGAAQAGAVGTAQCTRWVYTYVSPVDTTDFAVGENARMSGHTTGANNGDFPMRAINSSGNNIIVSNVAGVAQGGAAGNANTTRWIYALSIDPSTAFAVSDIAHPSGTTNPLNSGNFTVRQVKRLGTNNVVVTNAAGVAQGGAAGTFQHTKMQYSFSSDQSAVYSAGPIPSRVEIAGCVNALSNTTGTFQFTVLEVNRGGGANFNIVVLNTQFTATQLQAEQASPAGRVILESRSIFVNLPTLTLATSVTNSTNRHMQYNEKTALDFNAEATVAAGDQLACDLVQVPVGAASDVTVQLV